MFLSSAGRGAALQGSRSIGLQQAAPGSSPRFAIVPDLRPSSCQPIGSIPYIDEDTLGRFRETPAATSQTQPHYKAAPLPGLGGASVEAVILADLRIRSLQTYQPQRAV
jgi:hypothetical protein